jgi:hypothetical protein
LKKKRIHFGIFFAIALFFSTKRKFALVNSKFKIQSWFVSLFIMLKEKRKFVNFYCCPRCFPHSRIPPLVWIVPLCTAPLRGAQAKPGQSQAEHKLCYAGLAFAMRRENIFFIAQQVSYVKWSNFLKFQN